MSKEKIFFFWLVWCCILEQSGLINLFVWLVEEYRLETEY